MNEYGLILHLERLYAQRDRAAMAKLRRGLGKKMGTAEMYPYIVPHLPPEKPYLHEVCFLVASLFALHPQSAPRGTTMGKVFRVMCEGSASIEKRFVNLLAADADDVGNHLRHAVSLARSRGAKIDYHQLLHDLWQWDRPDRRVQLGWARDFWGYEKPTGVEAETDNGTKGDA